MHLQQFQRSSYSTQTSINFPCASCFCLLLTMSATSDEMWQHRWGSASSRASSHAIRKHRKRIAKIVCAQWLRFAAKRLTSYRHRRRLLLLHGLVAFKAALCRQRRLTAALISMKVKLKFLNLIGWFTSWQRFSASRAAMKRAAASLCTVLRARLRCRVFTTWCQQVAEMRWLAVCDAKATYFCHFMRIISGMRALKGNRVQQHKQRMARGVAVRHRDRRQKYRVWLGWATVVSLGQRKRAMQHTAVQFCTDHCLHRTLKCWRRHYEAHMRARTAFIEGLHSVATAMQQNTLRCVLRYWRRLAVVQVLLKVKVQALDQMFSSQIVQAIVPRYVLDFWRF